LFKNIVLEKKEGVAKITINRPEARNALDIETRKELLAALATSSVMRAYGSLSSRAPARRRSSPAQT